MFSRIAIFGLTGDPFTVAHRDICRQVMDMPSTDKLIIIPTIVDYHREGKKKWLSDNNRYFIIQEMMKSLGNEYMMKYAVDGSELCLKKLCSETLDVDDTLYNEIIPKRRFIHTLLDFKIRHWYDGKIMLVLGSDSVMNLPTWNCWKHILKNIDSLCVVDGRDGKNTVIPEELKEYLPKDVITISPTIKEYCYISASKIRGCYNGDMVVQYLDDVGKLDKGETTLAELGWI